MSEVGSRREPPSDSSALRTLAAAIMPAFESTRRQFRLSREDASDVEQETWYRYLRNQHLVQRPLAWLAHVFRNECRRFVTRSPATLVTLDEVPELEAVTPCPRPSSLEEIHPRLLALPVESRRLLWMRFVLGMTPREIAAAKGGKAASVSKALYRALQVLRCPGEASAEARSD
jgi:RNA polymerase sigma factor (sigma-70 family)